MKVGKYYFMAGELCQVRHSSSALNELVVYNFDHHEECIMNLHGAKLVAKPAFKIGEVARMLNKNPDTIRKWEIRNIVAPQKQWQISDKKSVRFYTSEDVEALHDMVKYVHVGRPRKDRRITNTLPDKGNLKLILRERMKNFNVRD